MSPELQFIGAIVAILGGMLAMEARWSSKTRSLIEDILRPLAVKAEEQERRIERVEGKASGAHDAVTRLQAQCETRH